MTTRSPSAPPPAAATSTKKAGVGGQSPARFEATPVARENGKYILFMDDEEILQELVSAMLTYLGYEVVCAADGVEAIDRYRQALAEQRPFSAVMVDLTIPGGMGGFETMQRLLAIDPDVRVIVSSGYSNDPVLVNHKQHGFSGVIAKPYQMAELDKVLQEAINPPVAK